MKRRLNIKNRKIERKRRSRQKEEVRMRQKNDKREGVENIGGKVGEGEEKKRKGQNEKKQKDN